MTNEGAIEKLMRIRHTYDYGVLDTEDDEALDMAIAALEAYVPDTNVGDMISRQAVIDLLKQMRKDGDMVPWEGKNVFARIRKLPSVQPTIIHCENCEH